MLMASWPQANEPRLPQLTPQSLAAPWASLSYGQQAATAALEIEESSVVTAWPSPWWSAQRAAPSAGWNIPLATYVAPSAFPATIVLSWQPAVGPPQVLARFIPPTPGNEPPRTELVVPPQVLASWPAPWWNAQGAAPNAGWNVPLLPPFVAGVKYPWPAVLGWQPPWLEPPSLTQLAPLTLLAGQQPPPWSWRTGPTILRMWQADWLAQHGAQIVALTLPSGQPPPRYTIANFTLVRGLWIPEVWNAQRAVLGAAWRTPLPVLALPLELDDLGAFRYIVADESQITIRYLVVDSSDVRYLIADAGAIRYLLRDDGAHAYAIAEGGVTPFPGWFHNGSLLHDGSGRYI